MGHRWTYTPGGSVNPTWLGSTKYGPGLPSTSRLPLTVTQYRSQ